MNVVTCDFERHAAPILAILNDAIVTSTALFDYEPRAPETMIEWFRAKKARQFPVLGAEDGVLLDIPASKPLSLTVRAERCESG